MVEAKYDQAWEMVEGLARVKQGEFFGAIDSTGKEVIPVRHTSLLDVQDGHLVAGEATGLGLLDPNGKMVVASLYDEVGMVADGVVRVQRNDRFAYLLLTDGRFIWKEEGFTRADPASAE